MKDHEQQAPARLAAAVTSLASAAAALSSQAQHVAELLVAGTGTSGGALALLAQSEAVMATAMPVTDEKLTLTQAETADILGVHTRTLQRLRAAGQGPKPIKIGAAVRYRRRDVERWLEGKRS